VIVSAAYGIDVHDQSGEGHPALLAYVSQPLNPEYRIERLVGTPYCGIV
jgi:hypothetical protein